MFFVFFLVFLLFGSIIMIPVVALIKDKSNHENAEWLKSRKIHDFLPDKKVRDALYADTSRRKWAIPDCMPDKTYAVTAYTKIYDYDNIVSYSLIKDDKMITKGGASIGRAVVGGILFGGVGAVIGGTTGSRTSTNVCQSLTIKVTLRNCDSNCVYIDFIKRGSTLRNADPQEVLSLLDIITKAPYKKPAAEASAVPQSAADEIKKYKELLDIGAITQEEFDAKKKSLLNI